LCLWERCRSGLTGSTGNAVYGKLYRGFESHPLRARDQKSEVRSQRSEVRDGAKMKLNSAKDLEVYKKAYRLAMDIFELTKRFTSEERFGLTGQIRRSSRSVCLNLREAWAKRRYEAHFVSKLTDCDGENSETNTSLDFARDCGYLTVDEH